MTQMCTNWLTQLKMMTYTFSLNLNWSQLWIKILKQKAPHKFTSLKSLNSVVIYSPSRYSKVIPIWLSLFWQNNEDRNFIFGKKSISWYQKGFYNQSILHLNIYFSRRLFLKWLTNEESNQASNRATKCKFYQSTCCKVYFLFFCWLKKIE